MVADADKFKAQDDAERKKVEVKNTYENYCYQMKKTLEEEKLKEHFTEDDKKTIEEIANEGLQFLESNPEAEAIEAKQKESEGKFNPIMMRVYQAAGPEAQAAAGGMPGMPGAGGAAGPGAAAPDAPMDDLD